MDFDLNKREFKDAIHLTYDWKITDTPTVCVCGDRFSVDHLVCNDVETEPVLHEITGETLNSGANLARDARLDIHAKTCDIRVCHPNADSYKDLTPEQVYCLHENEKKRMYERRVLEVERASFTPLVFTTTGGMGRECLRYHSRLEELISIKKGEDYAKTMTWIRGKFLSLF